MDRDLLERVRSESWPPPTSTGSDVRAHARRRGRRRASLAAIGATTLVVVVAAALNGVTVPGQDTDAVDQPEQQEITRFADVTFTIPQGWSITSTQESVAAHQACLGPSGIPTTDCPVLITVTKSPATTIANGLDVIPTLTQDCEPTDPRHVTVEETTVGGRQASHYVARCTATSLRLHGWALDNRSVHLTTSDPAWVAAAQAVFATVAVPQDWPEPDSLAEPHSAAPKTDPFAGQELATENFPRNAQGQTYGSDAEAKSPADGPDLVAVAGDHGIGGFVLREDLAGPTPKNPAEAAELTAGPRVINVYDVEGQTIVDTFTLQAPVATTK